MIGFSMLDWLALAAFLAVWLGWPALSARLPRADLSGQMVGFRLAWARQLTRRSDHVSDVAVARSLIASVSFFATTTVLVIGGLIGLLGAADTVVPMLQRSLFFDVLQPTTQAGFEVKVVLLLVLFVQAFFRFGWSIRLHAYTALLIGAMPDPPGDGSADEVAAQQLARLSSLASRHYSSGVQNYYLSAVLFAWFLHPAAMLVTLAITLSVIVWREYFSAAVDILLAGPRV